MAKSFTMQLLPAQKPVTSPVEPGVTPTSRDGVARRETPRNSESPTFSQVFFFLPLRDRGSTETAVRMSLRCPQVCATGRLERPLQCVVVILRQQLILHCSVKLVLILHRALRFADAVPRTACLACMLSVNQFQDSTNVCFCDLSLHISFLCPVILLLLSPSFFAAASLLFHFCVAAVGMLSCFF